MLDGVQVLVNETAPCFLTKATGIVTGVPFFGVRVIRPKY